MPAAVTELRFGTCEAAARERAARAPGSAGRAQRGLRQLSRGGAGVVWPEVGRGEATSRGRRQAASARRPSRARTRARNRLRRPARGRTRAPACRTPARQARSLRASAASLAVGPPPSARYRECGVRCHAMRRPPMLLRCSEALAQLLVAAFTRRALRPGNVASGDQCVRGTLAPRHHAGINILLSKPLGATGRKAALAPRHYRISRVSP